MTIASTAFSSPPTENGVSNVLKIPNNNTQNQSTPVVSEEALEGERREERKFLKETNDFLKYLAKKLRISQKFVNTAMIYVMKYTRINPYHSVNKFLVGAASLLLASKALNEGILLEHLVEYYIEIECKRIEKTSGRPCRLDLTAKNKEIYMEEIQVQEFDILLEVGFEFDVELPNSYIAKFASSKGGKTIFKSAKHSKFAYMFTNDAYTTTAPLYYTPLEIAATAIYMAKVYLSKENSKDQGEQETEEEWIRLIDSSLELSTIIEVKDEIKKVYEIRKTSSS
eukprot:CAMPEP_0205819724 /NCGR_PEP_ID=MMETSP0206-20130828/2181_1 /ASSEMBLY_ACC=CAM_ASM_000279 /TAXON_ID=36767 /ORGANISM="Euplotes focardii, Strain TN1" /LENGTH=282 /DNA_ID=CAMNT_0053113625 /DNA_START=114 /DNA_END=962 /DNA_ORIENTATION=+